MKNKQLDTKDLLMNKKEELIWRVIDNVINCCAVTRIDGAKSITREDVVGKSREENVVLTRCLVVEQMVHAGFTISTIAFILNRTVQAIRHLLKMSNDYYESSRAFRLSTSEATLLNKDVEPIHFNRKLVEFATSKMTTRDSNGTEIALEPITREQLDNMMKQSNVHLTNNDNPYDAVFVANMCKADYLGSSVPDGLHLCLYVKDVIDDVDGYDGIAFNRWYADMCRKGIQVDWYNCR